MNIYFTYQISLKKIDHYQNLIEVEKNVLSDFEL